MEYITSDLRIESIKAVTSPIEVCEEIPLSQAAAKNTAQAREAIHNVLAGTDDRLIVITGPCSIHDVDAAKEYAARLKPLIDKYADDLLIIMRVYFEKPRTTVGWKGLINDPDLDNSFQINKGIRMARKLLLDLNEMGVAAATEYLDL
ncbi:MAG: 3-deoxy-7-phosphoheptulonate synthase, partial [Gammaproteobacteria bacterium]